MLPVRHLYKLLIYTMSENVQIIHANIHVELWNSLTAIAITMQKVVELDLGVLFLSDLQMLTCIALWCKDASEDPWKNKSTGLCMVSDYVFRATSMNRLQDSLVFWVYGYMDKANITQYTCFHLYEFVGSICTKKLDISEKSILILFGFCEALDKVPSWFTLLKKSKTRVSNLV
ncbi:hypothetical protein STEG23_001678, partial [Scotinomys teguina]